MIPCIPCIPGNSLVNWLSWLAEALQGIRGGRWRSRTHHSPEGLAGVVIGKAFQPQILLAKAVVDVLPERFAQANLKRRGLVYSRFPKKIR